MSKIFFIADTHFWHTNIIKYCNRPFDNVEEMNEALINNWNSVVGKNDKVYHLGDFALGNSEQIKSLTNRLNGTIYLVRGNHDHGSVTRYESLGFIVLRNAPVVIDKYKITLSHIPLPDTMIPKGYINIHGHIHEKPLHEVNKPRGDRIEKYPKELYSTELHRCVSVDVVNFTPILLEDILNKKGEI